MEKGRKPKQMVHGSQRGEDLMEKVVSSFKGCGEVKENADRKDSIGLDYVQVAHWQSLP